MDLRSFSVILNKERFDIDFNIDRKKEKIVRIEAPLGYSLTHNLSLLENRTVFILEKSNLNVPSKEDNQNKKKTKR